MISPKVTVLLDLASAVSKWFQVGSRFSPIFEFKYDSISGWCLRVMAASTLYLINVVCQIFFTDLFLGYKFTKYGVNMGSFFDSDEDAADGYPNPAKSIFPRVAKCTFMKFGPSGTLQRHDAQCVLPINIINEKIYVFLWFWFCFLALISALDLLWLCL